MSKISAGAITKGMYLLYRDAPHQVSKAEFMNPGKGSAIMRVKLKNVQTGAVTDFTYKTNETVEQPNIDKIEMQFLYNDGTNVVFMEPRTYDQAQVPVDLMEGQTGYLIPDLMCWVISYQNNPIGVLLPPHVTIKVTEAPDAIAGNRVNAPKKLAMTETGLEVQVPLFVKTGESIIVDTSTGEYVSRAN